MMLLCVFFHWAFVKLLKGVCTLNMVCLRVLWNVRFLLLTKRNSAALDIVEKNAMFV